MGGWLANAMDIALLTGQRREDLSRKTFSEVREGRLFITLGKTGHMLAVPLTLKLEAAGIKLSEVIKKCRIDNPSDHIIYSSVRRGGGKPGAVLPDAITGAFTNARSLSGIQFGASPPSFHEI